MALHFLQRAKLLGSLVLLLIYQYFKSWDHIGKAAPLIMLWIRLIPRPNFDVSQSQETVLAKGILIQMGTTLSPPQLLQ